MWPPNILFPGRLEHNTSPLTVRVRSTIEAIEADQVMQYFTMKTKSSPVFYVVLPPHLPIRLDLNFPQIVYVSPEGLVITWRKSPNERERSPTISPMTAMPSMPRFSMVSQIMSGFSPLLLSHFKVPRFQSLKNALRIIFLRDLLEPCQVGRAISLKWQLIRCGVIHVHVLVEQTHLLGQRGGLILDTLNCSDHDLVVGRRCPGPVELQKHQRSVRWVQPEGITAIFGEMGNDGGRDGLKSNNRVKPGGIGDFVFRGLDDGDEDVENTNLKSSTVLVGCSGVAIAGCHRLASTIDRVSFDR